MPDIMLPNGQVTQNAQQVDYSRQLGADRGFGNMRFVLPIPKTTEEGYLYTLIRLQLEILDELVMARLKNAGMPYRAGEELVAYQQKVMERLQHNMPSQNGTEGAP